MSIRWRWPRGRHRTTQFTVALLDADQHQVGEPKTIRFRLRSNGEWANTQPITFTDLPAGTFTHVRIDEQVVPLDKTGWWSPFTIPANGNRNNKVTLLPGSGP